MHIQGEKRTVYLVFKRMACSIIMGLFSLSQNLFKKKEIFFCCVVEAVPTLANFIFQL